MSRDLFQKSTPDDWNTRQKSSRESSVEACTICGKMTEWMDARLKVGFCNKKCQSTFYEMKIAGKQKRKKKQPEDPYLPDEYPDVDTKNDLESLRKYWVDSNAKKDEKKKGYIVRRIKMLVKNSKILFQKKNYETIIADYLEKFNKLTKKKEYENNEYQSEEFDAIIITPFYEFSADFALYYDLTDGQMYGPLSINGLKYVDEEGRLKKERKRYSEDEGTQRALDDAVDIRAWNKDTSKILMYTK